MPFGINANYSKPGRGIRRDEPKKKGAALFFELLFRKFWSYVKLNILYFITCIPAFVYYTVLLMWLLQDVVASSGEFIWPVILLSASLAILILVFFAGSPCITGFHYVLRNFVREEHAWIPGDFFEHTKNNLKQGLAAFFIDVIFMTVVLVNLKLYIMLLAQAAVSVPTLILIGLFLFLLVVYACMHTFLWTMMVTFHLTLKQLYKNALLLTVLAPLRNGGSIIVRGALFAAMFFTAINPGFSIVLCALLFLSVFGLIGELFAYPTIKKFMLDKVEQTEEEYIEEKEDFYVADQPEEEEDPFGPVQPLEENDVASLFREKEKRDGE